FKATHASALFAETAADGTRTTIVTLRNGEARAGVSIALPRTYAISGRVLDDLGEPAARVEVLARGSSGGSRRTTDDLGKFRLYGLEPGTYVVCANPQNADVHVSPGSTPLLMTCNPSAATEGEAERLTLKAADLTGVEIQLRRSKLVTISGIVLDSQGW